MQHALAARAEITFLQSHQKQLRSWWDTHSLLSDQPFSRPGQVPGCALRYKHITFSCQASKARLKIFWKPFLWWVISATGPQNGDIKNLKHLTSKDVWVKFLDKLGGATILIKCYSVEALKLHPKRKLCLLHCITAQREQSRTHGRSLMTREYYCGLFLKVCESPVQDTSRR